MLLQHGSPANRTSPKYFDACYIGLNRWFDLTLESAWSMRVSITLDELRRDLIANTEGDCMELSPITRSGDGTASDLAFLGRPSAFCLATSARRSSLST